MTPEPQFPQKKNAVWPLSVAWISVSQPPFWRLLVQAQIKQRAQHTRRAGCISTLYSVETDVLVRTRHLFHPCTDVCTRMKVSKQQVPKYSQNHDPISTEANIYHFCSADVLSLCLMNHDFKAASLEKSFSSKQRRDSTAEHFGSPSIWVARGN
jgi:hypothetical protein